jgi:hypothetical protein
MPKSEVMILQALSKFEQRFDKVDSRLDSIEKVQIKQEANLGEHIRRTELAEENLVILRNDFKPIQKHVIYVEGFLKGLGILAMVVTLVKGVMAILPHL